MADSAARPRRKRTADAATAAEASEAVAVAAAGLTPAGELHVTRTAWSRETPLHRVHREEYGATQFNPGVKGDARFSPIQSGAGAAIPTLYGGSTFDCAAMETVFHDVSFAPGFKAYDKGKLAAQVHSIVKPGSDLILADLGTKALRKLGVRRQELIDTDSDRYPVTRQWAQAIHAQCPDVQGLRWTSRQDDSASAVMLFGDRIADETLSQAAPSRGLLADPAAYAELLALADKIGVDIVPGQG